MGNSAAPLLLIFFLLALAILSQEIQADHHPSPGPIAESPFSLPMFGAAPGSLHPQECWGSCGRRCSMTAYKKPCMFFCQKCCAKCLCVPPGTYGNKQFCPCYANWKTKRGGPKCP